MKKDNLITLKKLLNKKASDMMKTPHDNPALFHRLKADFEKLVARYEKAGGDINKPLNS